MGERAPRASFEEEVMLIIGIDPGASGGLAFLFNGGAVAYPAPETDRDFLDTLREGSRRGWKAPDAFAAVELVTGYVGDGGNPGSAMFKFGTKVGAAHMALTALGIPFELVAPRRWQKGVGVAPRGAGETKGEFKRRLRAQAQRLFPNVKVTLATADALLIAEWCRRKRAGEL